MASRNRWSPDRRDMIWINCNPQAGREMKDIHPLLVLSARAFNERTGIVIGLPMTTAPFNDTNPFAVKFVGPKGVASYILGHQPKSFDWRIRDGVKEIPIEERSSDEVNYADGWHDGELIEVRLTPETSTAANFGFDVTPRQFVTGLITERGICQANEQSILGLFPEHVVQQKGS